MDELQNQLFYGAAVLNIKWLFALLFSLTFAPIANGQTAPEKTLFIVGSTSAAKLFDKIDQPFYQQTGYRLIIRAIGSDKGVIASAEQVSDVGIISRYLTPAEQKRFPHLKQVTFAQDAIVFITNENNKQNSLRHQDIVNMYTSNSPIWPVTGNKAVLLSKDLGHGTHDAFIDYFNLNSAYSPDSQGIIFKPAGINYLYSNNKAVTFDRINQAIAYTSREENVLAYESLGAFKHFASTTKVASKLLDFEGIPVVKDGKLNRDYPVKRPLNVLVNDKHSMAVQALLQFLKSEEAINLIEENYYIAIH